MGKIYMYLARRDKKSLKILGTFYGPANYPATRVTNIKQLGLDQKRERDLTNQIYENRMFWEPWLEGAENFKDFRRSLFARGYANVPTSSTALSFGIAALPPNVKPKSMMRRGSQARRT